MAAKVSIRQRELDAAVRTAGGRGSKAVSEARAAAQGMRSGKGVFTGDRLQRLEGAVGKRLLKGALRGMLSPAVMAEGVVGAAAKWATEAKFKREAREQDKPTKGGMRRVKTKA